MASSVVYSFVASLLIASGALAQGAPPKPADMAGRHGDRCRDLVARQTGDMAMLEVRLNLSAAQKPLFARWSKTKIDAAKQAAETCAADAPPPPPQDGAAPQAPDPLLMLTREEARLQQRLAALKTELPALKALVASLSDEQKRMLMPRHHPMGPGGMMRHGDHGPSRTP